MGAEAAGGVAAEEAEFWEEEDFNVPTGDGGVLIQPVEDFDDAVEPETWHPTNDNQTPKPNS